MEIQATTALKKISSLKNKRIWSISGGAGSSKTFSILMILINHAASNPNKEIYVASEEFSLMRITVIKDFLKIMKSFSIYDDKQWVNGNLYRFPNGSFIRFLSLYKADIGKGLRSDIIFINEANKCKFESVREITSRAKKVIFDWNRNRSCWIDQEYETRKDCQSLKLTFNDNEYISKEERSEILLYKELGYDLNGNVINQYYANLWRVYGLGETGSLAGCVFENWEEGLFNDSFQTLYGLDFGSRDPDALVKISVDKTNNIIYVKEELYKNGLSTVVLADILKTIVPKDDLIIGDSAASRTITDLKTAGINIRGVHKNKIIDDIKLIQGYKLVIDESSKNLIMELSNYIWLDKRSDTPIDKDNHLIDAMRYAIQTLLAKPNRHRTTLVR